MITKDPNAVSNQVPPAFRDRYIIRCVSEEYGPSKAGNPMITLEWEICGHQEPDKSLSETVVRSGKKYMIAGKRNIYSYFTLLDGPSGQAYIDFRTKANLPIPENGIDENNPPLDHRGLVMNVILSDEETTQRKALTDEEREELKKAGKPMLGEPILDEKGEPIIGHRIKIDSLLGTSSVEINRPF